MCVSSPYRLLPKLTVHSFHAIGACIAEASDAHSHHCDPVCRRHYLLSQMNSL